MRETDRKPSDEERDAHQPRRLGWVLAPVVIFGAMAIMFAFALTSGDPSKLPSALIGQPAPKVAFPALDDVAIDGAPARGFSASDLADGQVTVVNFWASWCVPCVEEHPHLMALASMDGVRVFGVNYKDPPPGGRRFLARLGNPYTRVGTDASGRGAIEWGVYGMPETFVVDGRGRIVFKHVGPIDVRSLTNTLLPNIRAARSRATDR